MKKVILISLLFLFSFTVMAQPTQDSLETPQKKTLVETYTSNLNYFTITLLMTVESSFIPFPSEVVVPPAAYKACIEGEDLHTTNSVFINILLVILFATLGAIIGAVINYCLAFYLGRPFIYWFVETKFGHLCLLNSAKVKKAEDYFVEHGKGSTFFGRLIPAVRQLISIPAGLAKMKISVFILYTFLGAILWNIVLAVLGYLASGQQDLIEKYSHELSMIILAIVGVAILYVVIKALFFNKKREPVTDEKKDIA